MAVNTQFSIAVHIMAGLAYRCDKDTTSANLAMSVNTSPSFVRRVLAKLSRAGLVETATGKAGACWLAKDAKDISLLDIYNAVDAPKAFFDPSLCRAKSLSGELQHQTGIGESPEQNPKSHGGQLGWNQRGSDNSDLNKK